MKSAENSKQTSFFRQSHRSYIVLALEAAVPKYFRAVWFTPGLVDLPSIHLLGLSFPNSLLTYIFSKMSGQGQCGAFRERVIGLS